MILNIFAFKFTVLFVFLIPLTSASSNGNLQIIDFDMLRNFQNIMKDKDQRELDAAFNIYMQTAGFDDLLDHYQSKIHIAIEQRLQDALILTK